MTMEEEAGRMRALGEMLLIWRLSRLGVWVCTLALLLLAVIWLPSLMSETWQDQILFGGLQVENKPWPVDPALRSHLVYAGMPGVICTAFALLKARQLFQGYGYSEIFTPDAGGRLCAIGWAILSLVPADLLGKAYLMLVFDSQVAADNKLSLSFTLLDIDLGTVAFGLLAVIAGYILREAARVSEENKLFI